MSGMQFIDVKVNRPDKNQVELSWPDLSGGYFASRPTHIQLMVRSDTQRGLQPMIYSLAPEQISWTYQLVGVSPSHKYSFKVTGLKQTTEGFDVVAESAAIYIRAGEPELETNGPEPPGASASETATEVLSQRHLYELRRKAETFSSSNDKGRMEVTEAYKDESEDYWAQAEADGRLMKASAYSIESDRSCQSPISGQLSGVLFNVSILRTTGRPPTKSIHGTSRMEVDIGTIFNSGTNLYFADFNCTATGDPFGRRVHYVTLVTAPSDTDTDWWCKQHLLELEGENNRFMWRRDGRVMLANAAAESAPSGLIEVFYAKDYEFPQGKQKKAVEMLSGVKRSQCSSCSDAL